MIKVSVFDNYDVIRSIVPDADEFIRIAWAQENMNSAGYCVFKTDGEIISVEDKDNIFELLIRATLNSLDLSGIKTGFTKNTGLFPELIKLGFEEKNGVAEVDIKKFFKPCCHCK